MRKFNKNVTRDGAWFKLENDKEVQVRIRPFPIFLVMKKPTDYADGVPNLDSDQLWQIFKHSVLEWRGIEDENGPLEFNEDTKKFVFDYDTEIVNLVIEKSTTLRDKLISEQEVKNFETSPDGGDLKIEK